MNCTFIDAQKAFMYVWIYLCLYVLYVFRYLLIHCYCVSLVDDLFTSHLILNNFFINYTEAENLPTVSPPEVAYQSH